LVVEFGGAALGEWKERLEAGWEGFRKTQVGQTGGLLGDKHSLHPTGAVAKWLTGFRFWRFAYILDES